MTIDEFKAMFADSPHARMPPADPALVWAIRTGLRKHVKEDAPSADGLAAAWSNLFASAIRRTARDGYEVVMPSVTTRERILRPGHGRYLYLEFNAASKAHRP